MSQFHSSAGLVSLMQGGRLQFFHGGIIFIQHVSECPGCLDADDFCRVVEQGDDVGGFDLSENAGGGGSLERVEAVSGGGGFCLHARIGRPEAEELEQGGAPVGIIFLIQTGEEIILHGGVSVVCSMYSAGSVSVGGFGQVAVPFLYIFFCPVVVFVLVAHGAGVGHAQFFAESRIGRCHGVVTAGVSGHVVGLGHVALDATVAKRVGLVVGVLERINDGGFALSRAVAFQAKAVVFLREFQLGGMRVVAVETLDAGFAHATVLEACFCIDFVPLHAVRPEESGL